MMDLNDEGIFRITHLIMFHVSENATNFNTSTIGFSSSGESHMRWRNIYLYTVCTLLNNYPGSSICDSTPDWWQNPYWESFILKAHADPSVCPSQLCPTAEALICPNKLCAKAKSHVVLSGCTSTFSSKGKCCHKCNSVHSYELWRGYKQNYEILAHRTECWLIPYGAQKPDYCYTVNMSEKLTRLFIRIYNCITV